MKLITSLSPRATIKELYDSDFFVELDVKVAVINKVTEKSDVDKNDQKYQLQIELHKVGYLPVSWN